MFFELLCITSIYMLSLLKYLKIGSLAKKKKHKNGKMEKSQFKLNIIVFYTSNYCTPASTSQRTW